MKKKKRHEENKGEEEEEDEELEEMGEEDAMAILLEQMEEMNQDPEVARKLREQIEARRKKAFQEAGLGGDIFGALGVDKNSVHMINISDDPSMASCLIYAFKEGKCTIGSAQDNTIVLKGLGIRDHHCIVTTKANEHVVVEPIDPSVGKVVVNGKAIQEKAPLNHRDRLVFGHGNAYKIVIPKLAEAAGPEEN